MTTDEKRMWLCHECVGEGFLKGRIKKEGQVQKCSFCAGRAKRCPLTMLPMHSRLFSRTIFTGPQPADFEEIQAQQGRGARCTRYFRLESSLFLFDYSICESHQSVNDVVHQIRAVRDTLFEDYRRLDRNDRSLAEASECPKGFP
jgi:hypothetical protein